MSNASTGHSRAHLVFYIALVALLLGVGIQYTMKIAKPRKDGHTRSALLRWSKQLQQMDAGENIHETHSYPNPPIMAHMLRPFSSLAEANPPASAVAAALLFFCLKLGMALLCWIWIFRLVESPDRPFPTLGKAVVVVASLIPIIGDLKHANVNIFILFLLIASVCSFARGRDILAGLLLALAIACKVTPALFVVYFLWKRSWGALIGCGIGLVLFFFVVPSCLFAIDKGSLSEGWQQNWAALSSWIEKMIVPYLVHGEVTSERENQSLPGVLTRLLTHSPSFTDYVNDLKVPFAYHNFADLSAGTVKRLVQFSQLLFLVLMALVCRVPIRNAGVPSREVRQGWRLAAECSLILVGMLLFSERTWKHHCPTLMLPFAVLSYGAFSGGFPTGVRRTALATLVLSAGAILLTTGAELLGDGTLINAGEVLPGAVEQMELNPNSPRELAQVYGSYLFAFLMLIVGLSVMMLHGKRTAKSTNWIGA